MASGQPWLRDPRLVVFFAAGDLPPSAERVLAVLVLRGPSTHKDLVLETRLPPRTLRFALARLRASGIVDWRWSLRDARQRLYFVPDGPTSKGRPPGGDPSCS